VDDHGKQPSQENQNHAVLVIYVDTLTGVRVNDSPAAPSDFTLRPGYPNPFRQGQITQWLLRAPGAVEVRAYIYNVLGQQVTPILNGNLAASESILQWDGRFANGLPAASGAYFLRLEYRAGSGKRQVITQPVLLRK
jgi:hypothetical protein